MQETNDQLILISGETGTGKSTSLCNIRNQEKWVYLNCEAGKRLPFKSKFKQIRVTDPQIVFSVFEEATKTPECEGIIIDSITYLMDMFESQYVLQATNTLQAWSNYAQFFKQLMQKYVIEFERPVIMLAHTLNTYDEQLMAKSASVPVKGSLKSTGIESYFSTVVSTKKMPIKKLEPYANDYLHISDLEQTLGFKYTFQTMITKETVGERIRSPIGLFETKETFIDNDAQLLLDTLNEYYSD